MGDTYVVLEDNKRFLCKGVIGCGRTMLTEINLCCCKCHYSTEMCGVFFLKRIYKMFYEQKYVVRTECVDIF